MDKELKKALEDWDGDIENLPHLIQQWVNENKDDPTVMIAMDLHKENMKQLKRIRMRK